MDAGLYESLYSSNFKILIRPGSQWMLDCMRVRPHHRVQRPHHLVNESNAKKKSKNATNFHH
jgi:hypothetical protein